MGLDDRDWMRREREERWRDGAKRRPPPRRPLRLNALHLIGFGIALMVLLLAAPAIGRWVGRLSTPPTVEEPTPLAEAPEYLPPPEPEPATAQRETPANLPPRPLRDCLQGGNAIDEDVIRCQHHGQLPRNPEPQAEPQGMVSPEYLAKYREERDQRSARQASYGGGGQERDAQWIKSWDGASRYLAEWIVVNNQIDGGSVCGNQRWGSIEYRECRKGAKVFFREQCRAWGLRAENDRQDWSFQMKDRYCTAESSFSPMG